MRDLIVDDGSSEERGGRPVAQRANPSESKSLRTACACHAVVGMSHKLFFREALLTRLDGRELGVPFPVDPVTYLTQLGKFEAESGEQTRADC